ncbi:hypothetical protein, partial [Escherichia coli]|uniref:hypothetical protein n=1 Tax=Escherichia coli TaxID=562 RepID=UPI0015BD4CA7
AGKPTVARTTITVSPAAIGFAAVAKNKLDIVTVPAGYTVQVGARRGDHGTRRGACRHGGMDAGCRADRIVLHSGDRHDDRGALV